MRYTFGDDVNEESKPLTNPPAGNWEAPFIPASKGLSPGDSIADGRYTIQGTLGRGGMGTVYEAAQAGMDRSVAIKVLHREYSDNPSVVRRFHREAMAVSRLPIQTPSPYTTLASQMAFCLWPWSV